MASENVKCPNCRKLIKLDRPELSGVIVVAPRASMESTAVDFDEKLKIESICSDAFCVCN